MQVGARVEALKMFGYTDEELRALGDVANVTTEGLQELIHEKSKQMLALKEVTQLGSLVRGRSACIWPPYARGRTGVGLEGVGPVRAVDSRHAGEVLVYEVQEMIRDIVDAL